MFIAMSLTEVFLESGVSPATVRVEEDSVFPVAGRRSLGGGLSSADRVLKSGSVF